jgi:hypothetical protein
MHQVAPPSMTRLFVGALALVIAAATLVLALPADARAGAGNERLAKQLLKRDPGGAVGGKTRSRPPPERCCAPSRAGSTS